MNKKIIMLLCLVFSTTACAGDRKLIVKDLPPEARKLLGIDEKDYGVTSLIAITEKGPILYKINEGATAKRTKGKGKESPLNRTLVGKFSIHRFKDSPTCDYFDFNGHRYWYPSPPCPTK